MDQKIKPEETPKLISHDQIINTMSEGEDIASLRGLSNAAVDFIYAFSAVQYKNGHYNEAIQGFRFLCQHKHRDPNMWLALARSFFAKGDYPQALKTYLVVATLKPSAALCLEIARAFTVVAMPQQAADFINAAKRALLPSDPKQLHHDIQTLEKQVTQ